MGTSFDTENLDFTVGGSGGVLDLLGIGCHDPRLIILTEYLRSAVLDNFRGHGFESLVAKIHTMEELSHAFQRQLALKYLRTSRLPGGAASTAGAIGPRE